MPERLSDDCYDLDPGQVGERFREAKRQGRPAWLWPEVSVERWQAALRRIEATVRNVLPGDGRGYALEGDPEAVGLAGYTSGLGPLLGWWLEREVITASEPIAAILELHLRHNRRRALRMEAAALELTKALHRRGIAVVLLKGLHTGRTYFPEPGTRPASDIDLLIDPANGEASEAVLKDGGYVEECRSPHESNWRLHVAPLQPRSLRLVHAHDPWSVDLHTSLKLAVGASGPTVCLDQANPMSSRCRWGPSPDALVLEQPPLLMHLAAHAGAGLQSLTLLRLVELHLVVRQDMAAGRLSWDRFLELGEGAGSLSLAYPALKLCEQLAPGTVPDVVLDECARHTPPAVLRMVQGLDPASAQRVDRNSIAEHFMWADSIGARLRQVAHDVLPSRSLCELGRVYDRRLWQLIRGRFTR